MATALMAAALTLTACSGGNSSNTSIPLPNVDFPLPEVDENRPKTGREALYGVPWTTKSGPKQNGNIMGKSYFMFSPDNLSRVTLCTPIVPIKGKREWISPTATVKLEWTDKGFKTSEEATAKDKIEGKSCSSTLAKDVSYGYELKDDGEKLILTSPQDPSYKDELVIFRNR